MLKKSEKCTGGNADYSPRNAWRKSNALCLKGTVKFVDDAGQVHMSWENGSSLALNIDEDTFEKVETSEKISVILIEPDKYPKVIEIEDTLEAMQAIVEGDIEEYMPLRTI